MIILPSVISERFPAQFAATPRKVKWMFQKMFCGDVVINFFEVCVHI
jgi:hypothetical protein